nr:Chain D, LEDGF peptide [Homo sapiens]3AVI_F Chain F, LEDGF peptide [Homo sapiens]
SLKIDNMD